MLSTLPPHRADQVPLGVIFHKVAALALSTSLLKSQPCGVRRHANSAKAADRHLWRVAKILRDVTTPSPLQSGFSTKAAAFTCFCRRLAVCRMDMGDFVFCGKPNPQVEKLAVRNMARGMSLQM